MRWVAIAIAVGSACTPPEVVNAPIPPVSTGKVRVRVFTEPSPVKSVMTVGRFVFVATESHVERWDNASNSVLPLSTEEGLKIIALASDEDRRWAWILTNDGLGYYDAGDESYHAALAQTADVDFSAIAKEGAVLAPATDEGVWLGTQSGLVHGSASGTWTLTSIKEPIVAMARDRAGWLWVAAQSGLIVRKPNGDTEHVGAAHGCAIDSPRLFAELPNDQLMVIGTDENGVELIAIGKQLAWKTYRALPDVRWDAAARRGDGAVVMGAGRVYTISPAIAGKVRPLSRDGMRLVSLTSEKTDWVIDPLDVQTPPGAMALGAAGDALLIGTRDLGTARFKDGDARPLDWLRRRPMFQDATKLTVACAKEQDCWIATGGRRAWRWMGEGFVAGGPDQIVLAVVRDPAGPIYALHRDAAEIDIHVSRIDGASWVPIPKVALTTPGHAPEINFARFASSGSLWVGLRYHDGNETRAFGMAIVEPVSGKVTYHRTDASPQVQVKMLPIPIGVVDADVRGDVAYFATSEGIARLSRGEVKVWTEADGLQNELARAVTIAANGHVLVATASGAARWDGKQWEFPAALRFAINDVVATKNGQVWMATERGIAAWDGHKLRRVDTRRGLAENHILDIATDQYDRLWARGPGSLTLISQ